MSIIPRPVKLTAAQRRGLVHVHTGGTPHASSLSTLERLWLVMESKRAGRYVVTDLGEAISDAQTAAPRGAAKAWNALQPHQIEALEYAAGVPEKDLPHGRTFQMLERRRLIAQTAGPQGGTFDLMSWALTDLGKSVLEYEAAMRTACLKAALKWTGRNIRKATPEEDRIALAANIARHEAGLPEPARRRTPWAVAADPDESPPEK